jgi:hypothetical protein
MRSLLTSVTPASPRRVAIWGVAGAGKTQLAFQYALQYESEFSAVFYVNARDETSFRRDCLAIAKTLKLPELSGGSDSELVQDAVIEAVRDWLTDHDRGDWLLIVDNADNLDDFNPVDYLPATSKGNIILTSRNQQAVAFGGPGHSVELGGMEPSDAQQLFLKRSGYDHPTQELRDVCLDIVTKLGWLALPVEHAAAYVQSTGMLLHEYLESLERSLQPYLMNSSPFSLHKETIQATVKMSWVAINKRNAVALELLAFLAFLDNEGISDRHLLSSSTETIFRNWKIHKNRDDYRSAVKVLHSFSLVRSARVNDTEVIVSMHASVHYCIRALLTTNIQWKLLLRSAAFTHTISKGKPLDGALFPHARYVLRTATMLLRQPEPGDPPNDLWVLVADDISKYRIFWQITGLVHELDELSKIVIEALRNNQSDRNRIMTAHVMVVRLTTVQFTGGSDSFESVLRDYLIEQMTPAASEFMLQVHDTREPQPLLPDFNPYSLVDVFKHQTPPGYVTTIVEMLRYAAPIYMGRSEQQILGTVYLRLSQLPKSETWITQGRRLMRMTGPLTRPLHPASEMTDPASQALVAGQDRAVGKMDSTIALLRRIIDTNKPLSVSAGPFEAACYDLAKLLHNVGHKSEAAIVLGALKYANANETEVGIAQGYKDFYVWARKAHARTMSSHSEHPKLETMLQETYETVKKVFGPLTISTLHAQFLLQSFYLQPCCHSPSEAARIRGEITAIFTQLYGGRIRIRLGEALYMGKILMGQGAVEEALEVFELFAALAETQLGPDFPLTQRAKRWALVARRERSIEVRDEKAGRASLKFGCLTFPRDLKALGVD